MVDQSFFKKNGSSKLSYLVEFLGLRMPDGADGEMLIRDVAPLDEAKEGEISFLQNTKYVEQFRNTKASVCLIPEKFKNDAPEGCALLISENPYADYARVTQKFYQKESMFITISEKSDIDLSADIGDKTEVFPGAYIGAGCKVGKNCIIHANVSIENAIIGDNVIIHAGCAIGQDGFGYAFDKGGHVKVMQLGRVIIEDNVEIGANTTIDRGALKDTIIGAGTKIDNQVQIGHNVKMGKNCIMVSQSGISGSTEVGDYVVIAGQVGIAGHLKIGNRVTIAAKSGVAKDIPDGETYGGNPAVPIRDYHRQSAAIKKLGATKKDK